jgi:mono/diheme cytochrome c family protein
MRVVVFLLAIFSASAAILSPQQTHTNGSAASKIQAGTVVYQAHCAICHSVLPGATLVGPTLYGQMKSPSAASVRTIILNGKGKMRGLKGQLTQQDINNLLAYLRTVS